MTEKTEVKPWRPEDWVYGGGWTKEDNWNEYYAYEASADALLEKLLKEGSITLEKQYEIERAQGSTNMDFNAWQVARKMFP